MPQTVFQDGFAAKPRIHDARTGITVTREGGGDGGGGGSRGGPRCVPRAGRGSWSSGNPRGPSGPKSPPGPEDFLSGR